MTGLQTAQYFEDKSFNLAIITGATYPASWALLNGADIVKTIGSGDSREVYLREASWKAWITNAMNVSMMFDYWIVVPRVSTNNDPFTLISGGTLSTTPFADITVNTEFRRFYKIIKRGSRKIIAGDTISVKMKRYFGRSSRKVDRSKETGIEATRGLAKYMVVRFQTYPVEKNTGGTPQFPDTSVGPVAANIVVRKLLRYTSILDNFPVDRIIGNAIPYSSDNNIYTDVTEQLQHTTM